MAVSSGKRRNPEAADFAVIRWGLLIFVAFVVWQNVMQFFPTSLPGSSPSDSRPFSALWVLLRRVVLYGAINN